MGAQRRSVRRRGLSPLVSTIVLISAAIIGGILVYNYFQNSVNSIAASSGSLQISATSYYLNTTSKMVYVDLTNTYTKPVSVSQAVVVLPNGTLWKLNVDNTIAPGSKASLVLVVPSEGRLLYLIYEYDGKTMKTSPVSIG